jgi:hypothetical protein
MKAVTEGFSINHSKFDPILKQPMIFNLIFIWDMAVEVKNKADGTT